VAELRTRFGRHLALFEPQLRLTEAWLAAAQGNVSAAIEFALDAAHIAKRYGQRAIELCALHDAIRFGDRTSLQRVVETAAEVGGRLAPVYGAHADALAKRDAAAVYDAAKQFEQIGALLSAFAEDAASHTLLYGNADLAKATQAGEVLAFADHWKAASGRDPGLLIFDSKVTTQTQLAELDARGIRFITLRARTPKLTEHLHALPAGAWKPLTVARAGGTTRRVRVHEDPAATLSRYPGTIRQLAVAGLGHDEPTILISNDRDLAVKPLIEHYARRMNIEQRLAEAIRSFGLDALAGAVPLNVDLDVVLSVLAHTVCAALRRRLPGYPPPPPTSCNAASSTPAGPSSTKARRSSSNSTDAPTHPCSAKPTYRPPSPSPRGVAGACATTTPDPELGVNSLRENRR
jgi:hypothetical protein